MVNFKEGDRVVLTNSGCRNMGAEVGAIATVGKPRRDTLVNVLWDRDSGLCGNQMDGGYYATQFELIGGPW